MQFIQNHGHITFLNGSPQNENKLVAMDAGNGIIVTNRQGKALCNRTNNTIATTMTMGIHYRLETGQTDI